MSHTFATVHHTLTVDLAPAVRRAKADFLEMPGLRLTAAERSLELRAEPTNPTRPVESGRH
jgi:hypothetical protein